MRLTAPPAAETGRRDAEGMAVASFVTGLAGLLVLNLILGPTAIVLAVLALRRGTPAASAPGSAWASASPTWWCWGC